MRKACTMLCTYSFVSKHLASFRCMACDRPLDKLDERPGPYIINAQMPLKV